MKIYCHQGIRDFVIRCGFKGYVIKEYFANYFLHMPDEATSALDEETERKVMQNIENLSDGLTILIVAHRVSTLALCDQIIRLDQGKVEEADFLVSSITPNTQGETSL